MSYQDRRRAESFGENAAQYDRTRPTYPEALIDDLLEDGVERVLDVGCGTGIAARQFRDRGCLLVGVEQDARMAELATSRGLDVDVARFKAWPARGTPFDLVISAQAWHWIDPAVGPGKAADVLRPGGRLAAFWNGDVLEPDLLDAIRPVYERLAPDLLAGSVVLGTIPEEVRAAGRRADVAAIKACGMFDAPEERDYPWECRYPVGEWVDRLATHSGHRTLDPSTLTAIVEGVHAALSDAGRTDVCVRYETRLLTARRAADEPSR